jgi:hypothetical protein
MERDLLSAIHNIACELEDAGFIREANVLSDVFVKVAAKKKKKKSSGKNVPNNPSLWASCQAWAKANYEVHPSAYSNSGAARRYKQKGGTWRKSK